MTAPVRPFVPLPRWWRWGWGWRVAACVLLAGCTAQAEHPALRDADLAPLIPAHRFAYRGTVSGGYQVSPDGHKLLWVGPSWGRSTLFVRDNRSGRVREYRPRGPVQWTADSRRLLYVSDAGSSSGTENPHVFMIDTEGTGTEAVDLTPYPGVRASIRQIGSTDPRQVLVLHNRRNPKLFDLYRIDLETRAETLVARNPGDAVAPVLEDNGQLLGWQPSREARRTPQQRQTPQAERLPAIRERKDESVRIVGAASDPQVAWALSNRGRDRVALVALQRKFGWEKAAFEDPVADLDQVAISSVTGQPLLATATPGLPRVEILDEALRKDLAPLLQPMAGKSHGLALVSTDKAERRMVFNLYTDTRSDFFLLDRDAGRVEPLGGSVPDDLAAALVPMQPVQIASRDGLTLHGYLTLPHGVAPKGLPMVLLVHGGPWSHATWGDPMRSDDNMRAQFLANRGYAVLQVNFRGSTGYGRAFRDAAVGEFAGRMQDDLVDAVQWAIGQGIADPARIATMGLSYGGYASLMGLAATPQLFACGISVGGPTDLATLIESFPAYWAVDLSMWHDFVGNPKLPQDRAAMTARSPLTQAARFERPVLLLHGERDVRVRLDQSQRMAQALRDAGKAVRLVTVPEMGHTPGYWVHQQKVLRETETFLHDCLGGRATRIEPFDWLAWLWPRIS